MSVATRRRMMWFLAVVMLTLPIEAVMVSTMARDDRSIADSWVARLDASELDAAAARIEELPVEFRRNVITALSLEKQAAVWRRALDNFVSNRRDLDAGSRELLMAVRSLATVETLSPNGEARREQLRTLANLVNSKLGPDTFKELFINAGPVHRSATALPLRVRLEMFVDSQLVAKAFGQSCNCNMNFSGRDCSSNFYCTQTVECDYWSFGCGVWYQDPCNGYCLPNPQN